MTNSGTKRTARTLDRGLAGRLTANVPETVWDAFALIEDPELRTGVVALLEYARDQAATSQVDLIVLSARRLACLYAAAVEAGLPPIDSCEVVSDRIFDLAADWSDRKVLVLDDSVVVGTTLTRLHDEISQAVGRSGTVRCAAVCLDVDQIASYLLEDLDLAVFHTRSSDGVSAFSRDVVTVLFANGIPFFSDFPSTRTTTVAGNVWTDFLRQSAWHVADVTAPLLADERRKALVQVPTGKAIEDLLTRMRPEVAQLVESFKLRSFSGPHAPNDNTRATPVDPQHTDLVDVRFVPLAMLRPCRPAELDVALQAVAEETGSDQLQKLAGALRPEAKHRFVQLYASCFVLARALGGKRGQQLLGRTVTSDDLDRTTIRLYFGARTDQVLPLFDRIVRSARASKAGTHPLPFTDNAPRPSRSPLLRKTSLDEVLWGQRELLAAYDVIPTAPSEGELTKVGLVFAHAIVSVFGAINDLFEIPQRKKIRDMGSRATYKKSFGGESTARILNQGLTLRELTESLAPQCLTGPSWTRSLVSLGIDIGNDLGIIVPVTRTDSTNDIVYRSYRLGETADMASTPLFEAAHSGHWDFVTTAASRGFPLLSQHHQLQVTFTPPQALAGALGDEWQKQLRDLVIKQVPTPNYAYRFKGTVLSVEDDAFVAEIVSRPEGEVGHATIPIDQVEEADRTDIRPGADFFWTVYRSDSAPDGLIPRVRLLHRPPLDLERMARTAQAYAWLGEGQ